MRFSTTQLQAIKSAIQADATALAFVNAGNPGACADYLNGPSAIMLIREDVSNRELFHALAATEVVALSSGQQTLLQLAGLAGTIDFTNPNVSGGLTAVFPSTTKTYANIMAIAQRPASFLEGIFTSNGVCSLYGATIDSGGVQAAMAS